jgi:hypothetical protein
MIFAKAQGRLGNQLFYFSLLARACNDGERVVATGFRDLTEAFPGYKNVFPSLRVISPETWVKLRVGRILKALLKARIIGSLLPGEDQKGFLRTRSLFGAVTLAPGYFQNDHPVGDRPVLALRQSFLDDHPFIVEDLGLRDSDQDLIPKCFVHVRRGDYLHWPKDGPPAALPIEWYLTHIEGVSKESPSTRFLVFSDDVDFCREQFSEIPNVEVVDRGLAESFVAMSLCRSGILSASSLSWWSAKLSSSRHNGLFIAPTYWFWWPRGKWRPDDELKKSSFIQWREVLAGKP